MMISKIKLQKIMLKKRKVISIVGTKEDHKEEYDSTVDKNYKK